MNTITICKEHLQEQYADAVVEVANVLPPLPTDIQAQLLLILGVHYVLLERRLFSEPNNIGEAGLHFEAAA